MSLKHIKKIYLDYAAATPLDPIVEKAMKPFWHELFGNPSSLHSQGVVAKKAVEESRKKIAQILGAWQSEIIFTAGGTESCNLAIFGVAREVNTDAEFSKRRSRAHIITTAIEHHAVLKPIEVLKGEGFDVTELKVNSDGLINLEDLEKAIRPETILISIMYANNEVGSIQPIAEIGKLIRIHNSKRRAQNHGEIIFHTDACQAPGLLDINVQKLGVDLMSVNGSKIYGPKQTGFLFVRNGINIKPLIYGGGQENNMRSGTENVAGIVGLAKALELGQRNRDIESKRISKLQESLISKLLKTEGIKLNGPKPGGDRLPNNINLLIPGVEGEALMLYLDSYGIEVSTGSACSTGEAEASHVLTALGLTEKDAKSSIRISLGKQTNKTDLDYTVKVIELLIKQLRKVVTFN